MLGETYQLFKAKKYHEFAFISRAPKGGILKMVKYKKMEDGVYNLGFGDVVRGKINDKAISNNKDLIKVMNTIAETIYIFQEHYPDQITAKKTSSIFT